METQLFVQIILIGFSSGYFYVKFLRWIVASLYFCHANENWHLNAGPGLLLKISLIPVFDPPLLSTSLSSNSFVVLLLHKLHYSNEITKKKSRNMSLRHRYIGARNPKVWGSIPHGDSEFFLCSTFVTRREKNFPMPLELYNYVFYLNVPSVTMSWKTLSRARD